ncbi:MAG TPA: single-stranded DNA-binding protein [Syntrophales bacterium]|nr:single-stranded DNA-binding protein [Syntrophales bacterium]HOH73462.1 single-stranded DNA-binding protein [Syntrophales bacterium]HPN08203.1 single-stranded DNA-binding protein [Syntrophales bacterium]HQB14049.1 single-stranded DNA-binding protein [Syntrophales bacterium]
MINTVTIVGNLGQDPEIRYTASGVPVAGFTVAVNEIYKGKDGQKVKKVHWFRVTAFQRLAEIVGEYCTKGVKVGVHGQLQQRTWQGEEGFNRSIVEIRARELELLGGRNGNQSKPEGDGPSERTSLFNEDDDVPF